MTVGLTLAEWQQNGKKVDQWDRSYSGWWGSSRVAFRVTLIGIVTFPIHQARPDFPNHLPDGAACQFKHLIWSHPSSDNMIVGLQLAGRWAARVHMWWTEAREAGFVGLPSLDRICSPPLDHGTGGGWERMKRLPCVARMRALHTHHSTWIPIKARWPNLRQTNFEPGHARENQERCRKNWKPQSPAVENNFLHL